MAELSVSDATRTDYYRRRVSSMVMSFDTMEGST
jgi:hypothetical protein